MSLLVTPRKQSFLRKQESRKNKANTGFPLKDCGNDGKSNMLLFMVFLVSLRVLAVYSLVIFTMVILWSCAVQKEEPPVLLQPEIVKQELVLEQKKIEKIQTIQCKEDTDQNFNMSGLATSPFLKVAFYDMNGDGLEDMISGDKYGRLNLYENSGDQQKRQWKLVKGYFDGIKISAFSAPAVGDIDGDGRPEVVVGTGGFSSESGRILFFKNAGTDDSPQWEAIKNLNIRIGNDAAATIVDYNFDGRPDIIAGNSEGRIFFFKNTSTKKNISFKQDKSVPLKRSFGMYAVPAAVKINDRVILVIGNSRGKLYMFEMNKDGRLSEKKLSINASAKMFLTPSFASLLKKDHFDLVLADGDGVLSYFENKNYDYTGWERNQKIFNNRIFAGPVCTPTFSNARDKMRIVIGNIDGTFKLYEYQNGTNALPWIEKVNYFKNIKVTGFSRGLLTDREGQEMLITGESSGDIKAFIKVGTEKWKEEKNFFKDIHINHHSAPAVFDLDGDGRWEIVTGAEDGKIYAYRAKEIINGLPVWERITGIFDNVKVNGFSAPSVAKGLNEIYLVVGQQNGGIRAYKAESNDFSNIYFNKVIFYETGFLKDVAMNNHSSPFMIIDSGVMEVVSGDYDGNLRHFVCR